MTLVIRIVFFCLIFFSSISIALSEINLKIIMKINNEIITSYDIEKERDYLLVLNPKLKMMDKEKIFEISKKSLIKETIRKNEILKYKKLDLQNPQIGFILNDIIKDLGFQNLSQFQSHLGKLEISIDDIKEKIEIENQWKSLVYAKYSSSLKVDTESLKKQIENTSKENFLLEYNLSEIVLTKKNDLSMDDLINEVQESIKNVGFENTAILYSISDSSKTGGKIGWIKKNNLDAIYGKLETYDNDLPELCKSIKKGDLDGLNVTVPFKKSIIPHLDILSSNALRTQSVNTISLNKGHLIGDNTDINGFELSIRKLNYDVSDKTVLILGAGGVVPSIIFSLLRMKVSKIFLSNRTKKKAEDLTLRFHNLEILDWGKIADFDMIINATSLGLKNGKDFELSFEGVKRNSIFNISDDNGVKSS